LEPDLLLVLLFLLARNKQDPTNDEAKMTNEELRLIARRESKLFGDLEIAFL